MVAQPCLSRLSAFILLLRVLVLFDHCARSAHQAPPVDSAKNHHPCPLLPFDGHLPPHFCPLRQQPAARWCLSPAARRWSRQISLHSKGLSPANHYYNFGGFPARQAFWAPDLTVYALA